MTNYRYISGYGNIVNVFKAEVCIFEADFSTFILGWEIFAA